MNVQTILPVRPSHTTRRPAGRAFVILALAALIGFAVPALASALWLKVLTSVVIYTLTAAAIALLYRRIGQVSLAHVALMGFGGWIALRSAHGLHLPFEFNIVLGGVATSIIGMALAWPALRMRGLYLALVTLMAAGAFSIFINVIQFPNGGDGWSGFAVKSVSYMPRPWIAQSDEGYFTYCVAVIVLGFGLIHWHEISKPGRAWAMIRRSEAAAMASGVDVTFFKVWGFALSGFLAGIAGGLLAGNLLLLDAQSFPASESVMIFALTIVGGSWHWFGAIIGAALYRLMPAVLNNWGVNGNAAYIIFGAALMHALMTAPTGIAGQISGALSALTSRKRNAS